MRPDLLPGGRIPRLQLAEMIGAGTNLQTDIFGLGPEPKLAGNQRHLLAGKAAAEILVGRNVDQAGLLAIGRRRPILAAPQRRAELNPLADDRLVVRVDDRPAGLGLDAFPDIGINERPAGDIVDAVRLALEHPEDRVAAGMNQALERAAIPLQVDQHRCVHLVPIPGIVLMVLVVGLDLAAVGIEPQHRAGVEVVAGVRSPAKARRCRRPNRSSWCLDRSYLSSRQIRRPFSSRRHSRCRGLAHPRRGW